MRVILATLLIGHGVAHVVGFAVPWKLVHVFRGSVPDDRCGRTGSTSDQPACVSSASSGSWWRWHS